MTTFVTVAVQRIQTHLSRSRHLWGRRGASEELVRLTLIPESDHLPEGLAAKDLVVQKVCQQVGVKTCRDAVDIDGVVVFEHDDHDKVLRAGRALAQEIRASLPASQVSVSWATGATYAATLGDDLTELGQEEIYYPSVADYPPSALCAECGTSPVVERISRPGDTQIRVCADCATRSRQNWRGRSLNGSSRPRSALVKGRSPSRFTSEWWLLDQVSTDEQPLTAVDDFEGLAKLGGTDRGNPAHSDNHLALIFADGNGLGAMFVKARAAAQSSGCTLDMKSLSADIKFVTGGAILTAAKAVLSNADVQLPVVPHILGGDDVLVSLPASRAWPFLRAFLSTMRTGFQKYSEAAPSVSAGMVICHRDYPIANQVELAETLLLSAKRHVAGRDWSFLWADVTAEGPIPPLRTPWKLSDLDARADALDMLNGIPKSSKQRLQEILSHVDANIARQLLDHQAARMDGAASFLSKLHLSDDNEIRRAVITDSLSIGRWWR